MITQFENLDRFFEQIKTINFWDRVFGWRKLRQLSYSAFEEFRRLLQELDSTSRDVTDLRNKTQLLESETKHLTSNLEALQADLNHLKHEKEHNEGLRNSLTSELQRSKGRIEELEPSLIEKQQKIDQITFQVDQLQVENTNLKKVNAAHEQAEASKRENYEKQLAVLTSEINRVRYERQREVDEIKQSEMTKIISRKETWSKHQSYVNFVLKSICQRHTVQFIDKVPFKGSPDNTIKIADEFVIFDAKSPASDDLQNFPQYIKAQTESVKKYVNEENVRKEIFLVVPFNTLESLKQFAYNLADYTVYILSPDALEPVILSLKKIEEYEFVNQLSPEERENVCRLIGKFAHMTKRRIQIDQFFAWEFLEILTRCKSDLPKEILDKVIEFEKSEKLNPPQEKRSKQILTKELENDQYKIQKEAEAKEIVFPKSAQLSIKMLPLYGDEGAKQTVISD